MLSSQSEAKLEPGATTTATEIKTEPEADEVLIPESLEDDSVEGFDYHQQLSDSEDRAFEDSTEDDTFQGIQQSLKRQQKPSHAARRSDPDVSAHFTSNQAQGQSQRLAPENPITVVRPCVIDDFFRNFLAKMEMHRTIDCFNTEWYERLSTGKLDKNQTLIVPDIYLRNQELDEQIKELQTQLERAQLISEKAQAKWDSLRKERDTHRMHHKRVVIEKNKLTQDIKRLKNHYASYEPTMRELNRKYELCMKEKMMMRLDRDKLRMKCTGLESQIKAIEDSGSATQQAQPSDAHIDMLETKRTEEVTSSGIPGNDAPNPYLGVKFEAMPVASMQLKNTFEGHVNTVSSVSWHPSKPCLATASNDHTIKLWSVPDGNLILLGEGHSSWVSDVDFHPSGKLLASSSGDGSVKIWDFHREEATASFADHAQPVWSVAWHHEGDFLVSGSMDKSAKLWDIRLQTVRQTLRGHKDSVNSVVFQPFSSNIGTASADKTISIWDARSGLCVLTFYGHTNSCNELAFNIQGDTVASADTDGVVKLWELRMPAEKASFTDGDHPINSIAFDKSGTVLAAASDDGTVKLFDTEKGTCMNRLSGHSDAVQSVAFDPECKMLVTGSSDATFRLWQ